MTRWHKFNRARRRRRVTWLIEPARVTVTTGRPAVGDRIWFADRRTGSSWTGVVASVSMVTLR